MNNNGDEKLIIQSNRLKNPCLIALFIFELIVAVGLYLVFIYIPAEINDRTREIYFKTENLFTVNNELRSLNKLREFLKYGKWYLLGLAVILLFFILYFICFKVILTNEKLYGVREFGKRVVIPVSDIKTVTIGGFHKLVVEGVSKKNVFYGINNYRDICSEIQDLKYRPIGLDPANQSTDKISIREEQGNIDSTLQTKTLLSCELCGGTNLLKQDGVFVCQSCGAKYTVEEAKKLMSETAPVEKRIIKEPRILNNQYEDYPVYKPTPVYEKVRRVFITLGIIVILVGGTFIVYRKARIKYYVSKAEKAIQNQDYVYARKYYEDALKWDELNDEINGARNNMENDLRDHDARLMVDLHTALCTALYDPTVLSSTKFKIPKKGDYSLYEFCRERGDVYQEAVNSYLGNHEWSTLNSELYSRGYDGSILTHKQIRVALYEYGGDKGIEMCVYVPGAESYAYGGVRYKQGYSFK